MDEAGGALPEPVRRQCGELLELITVFNERIGALDREVRERARADDLARRLMTIPSAACWPRSFQGSIVSRRSIRFPEGPGPGGPGGEIEGLLAFDGVGPVTALALSVLAPPAETFKCGRDLAAWIGLTPRIATAAAFEWRGQPAGADFEDGPA